MIFHFAGISLQAGKLLPPHKNKKNKRQPVKCENIGAFKKEVSLKIVLHTNDTRMVAIGQFEDTPLYAFAPHNISNAVRLERSLANTFLFGQTNSKPVCAIYAKNIKHTHTHDDRLAHGRSRRMGKDVYFSSSQNTERPFLLQSAHKGRSVRKTHPQQLVEKKRKWHPRGSFLSFFLQNKIGKRVTLMPTHANERPTT